MSPRERAVAAANVWNAGSAGHFPGRPLFEGVVENAIAAAVAADRAQLLAAINKRATESESHTWYHVGPALRALAVELGLAEGDS